MKATEQFPALRFQICLVHASIVWDTLRKAPGHLCYLLQKKVKDVDLYKTHEVKWRINTNLGCRIVTQCTNRKKQRVRLASFLIHSIHSRFEAVSKKSRQVMAE